MDMKTFIEFQLNEQEEMIYLNQKLCAKFGFEYYSKKAKDYPIHSSALKSAIGEGNMDREMWAIITNKGYRDLYLTSVPNRPGWFSIS